MTSKVLLVCAAASIASASSSVAWSQCDYEYEFIPAPLCSNGQGKIDGAIRDFHESLHTVGYSNSCGILTDKAYRRWPNGAMDLFPAFPGVTNSRSEAVRSDGTTVGWCDVNAFEGQRAWVWLPGQTPIFLESPGQHGCIALSISEDGFIAGHYGRPDGSTMSATWMLGQPGVEPLDGELPKGSQAVVRVGNALGDFAGEMVDPASTNLSDAYVRRRNGVWQFLPNLGPNCYNDIRGMARHHFVVGRVMSGGQCGGGVMWNWPPMRWAGGSLEMLPTDPPGTSAGGLDVNSVGQTVGLASPNPFGSYVYVLWIGMPGHPVIGPIEIEDLLPDWLQSQVSLSAPRINERGEIACAVTTSPGFALGPTSSVILRPIRNRSGDVTIDCAVDVQDIEALFSLWGIEDKGWDNPADLNDDGLVDAYDLAMVLADWGPKR